MNTPKVSVIMPVYNGEKYLREAIESILSQTFKNFEFIIINDGSTDKTEDIILSYRDPRIVYIKNEINLKIVETLNKGLAYASGEYIARMDADDISLPDRLKMQVNYMDRHKNVGVCGCSIEIFGEEKILHWSGSKNDKDIKAKLFFNTQFAHPTVMMRRSIFLKNNFNYSVLHIGAEDYALWTTMAKATDFYNLQKILLRYRVHEKNKSLIDNTTINDAKNIRINQLIELIPNVSLAEIDMHNDIICRKNLETYSVDQIKDWLKKLLISNGKKKLYSMKYFHEEIYTIWIKILYKKEKNPTIKNKLSLFSLRYYIKRYIHKIGKAIL